MKTSKRTMSKTGTLYYSVLDWVTNHRTKLSYTETYLKIIVRWLLMISTVSPSNVIDPNISDEKDLLQTLVYVDNWRQSNFDASIYGLYYNDKIGSMKLVTKWICCCSSLPFEYWYGSNLWFWNHVWLEFKPNFFEQKKTLSGMSSLTLP
jgi:hypothetical protein